ncbi:MAG TPA: flagellar basal body rod protein FlgC [Burkholderiaceae bacterium]|jgi:flagellar basal-body rod protein FlgC|nr:flagellar basal body rod protein FlgC [Burkholderiaceae bacterium]
MSLFNTLDVVGSALTAQSKRLNVVASNLANADSVTGPDGQPYRARQVVFSTVAAQAGVNGGANGTGPETAAVAVAGVVESDAPMRRVHQPGHPLADADGFVTLPNVDVVEEMVNMISASRSYQANVEVATTTRSMAMKALTLGQ